MNQVSPVGRNLNQVSPMQKNMKHFSSFHRKHEPGLADVPISLIGLAPVSQKQVADAFQLPSFQLVKWVRRFTILKLACLVILLTD
jgi:hypothetical protein